MFQKGTQRFPAVRRMINQLQQQDQKAGIHVVRPIYSERAVGRFFAILQQGGQVQHTQTVTSAAGTSIYQEELPEEILQELPEEIQRQYFLWDEILKREAELYPGLLLPLIEEIFHKRYPKDTKVVFLATEYVVSRAEGKEGKIFHSVYSDLVIQVGAGDIYHLECQMKRNQKMVVRMMEYDLHIAMTYGVVETGKTKQEKKSDLCMFLPYSAILYLEHGKNTSDHEKCRIYFQDGGSHLFEVPVLKVQDYTLEQIEQKKLFLLIPFLPLRFRKHLKKDAYGIGYLEGTKAGELTEALRKGIMILDRQRKSGALEESVYRDLVEFLWKACSEVFGKAPKALEEVQKTMQPVIRLMRDDIEDLQKENKKLKQEKEKYRKESEKNRRESEKNRLENEKLLLEIEKLRARLQ